MRPRLIMVTFIAAVALAGCASPETAGAPGTRYVELPDGRSVLCVLWVPSPTEYTGAQLSCDWDHAPTIGRG